MIINGTIQFGLITGGGLDGNGDPLPVTTNWSDSYGCNIKENFNNLKGSYQDGDFRMSSYQILVDEIPEGKIERVRLVMGAELGEFRVQGIRPMESVGRVRIVV